MDIDILLMLQNFRVVIQDALTPFMEKSFHFSLSTIFSSSPLSCTGAWISGQACIPLRHIQPGMPLTQR